MGKYTKIINSAQRTMINQIFAGQNVIGYANDKVSCACTDECRFISPEDEAVAEFSSPCMDVPAKKDSYRDFLSRLSRRE